MSHDSLEQLLQSIESPVDTFRGNDLPKSIYRDSDFPDEYTHWIEEQRAVEESCFIVDQSYHMTPLYIEGPDALGLLSDLGTNSFENFKTGSPPQAKNLVLCNHDGYRIRDAVLFYLDEESYVTTGSDIPTNWIEFNAETGDYDVSTRRPYEPGEGEPEEFRFEVQGPEAMEVMEEVTDEPLPEISFFQMDQIAIDGVEMFALAHGMAGAPGLEIFGSYEHHDEVWDAIVEAGEEYGIREMGSQAYKTGKIGTGWIQMTIPAIYESEEMREYREWLDTDTPEANMSIGGSYYSDDITDYYMDPFDCGQDALVSFDHDFVGREALEERAENKRRTRVTYVWDDEDVVDVYASLFSEGDTYKFIDLPDTARRWSMTNYDRVEKDGEIVGISKYPGYVYYERSMLSLGVIDVEHSEPGTEVTMVWGEEGSTKDRVERHVEKEITATVGPSPYVDEGRLDM